MGPDTNNCRVLSNRQANFNTVKLQEEAAKYTARTRHDSLLITAKLNEDNEKYVKKQAAKTHRIQEIVERLKVSDELFKRQLKKFKRSLDSNFQSARSMRPKTEQIALRSLPPDIFLK